MKKILSVLLAALMLLAPMALFSAQAAGDATTAYTPPPSDVAMELDMMMWSGSGTYWKDIGHQNLTPDQLKGQNDAAAYATAKAFNELYPNVKINVFAKAGDPNQDENGGPYPWAQHIENFRAEHGKYPDFYCATDLPGDIQKGLCADISKFSNDPVYQSFNPGVMSMMNYNGHQFALPQYLLPWGVFINKTLAENNNIDIPEPNWTIDDYTEFTNHSSPADWWYGAMDAPRSFFITGSKGFAYSLTHHEEGQPYVNLATDSFYSLMSYIPKWCNNAVYPQNDLGNTPAGFMDDGWWWGYRIFQQGRLLAYDGDPWMMGDQANPDPASTYYVNWDWDIYPRPSTPEMGNTVGVVLDPFAIHNYDAEALAGNITQEEADLKLAVTYEFAKFWCADTRAWKARAEQMWTDGAARKTALNDSLPLVSGAAFDDQMAIWYSTATHGRFADAEKMPGFQAILDIWRKGDVWDISDKCYPWYYEVDGSSRMIMYEYENSWNVDVVGAVRTDANWLDNIKARMPDWNTQFNQRFSDVFAKVQDAIDRYYK